MTVRRCSVLLLFISVLLLSVGAREGLAGQAKPTLAVVDVEKIMTSSKAAVAAREHLDKVRATLEQGFEELKTKWQDAEAEQKQRVLLEGMQALNRQMQREEAAAQNVVNTLLLAEIKAWRAGKAIIAVVAKQNLLDSDAALDVTDAILARMDAKSVTFDALPSVKVKDPQEAAQAAKEAQKGQNATPAQDAALSKEK